MTWPDPLNVAWRDIWSVAWPCLVAGLCGFGLATFLAWYLGWILR